MCIRNHMLITFVCYTAPIPVIHLTMKLPYSDKREKNSASFKNTAKGASFLLKTKYKCLCECSPVFLHLENYPHK